MYPETAEVPIETLVLLHSIGASDPAWAVGVAVSTLTSTCRETRSQPDEAYGTVNL